MQVLHAILAHILADNMPLFSEADMKTLVEGECYQLLQRIRDALADETLDDPACILKIEEVISILNDAHIDTGSRHDFG